ncbi:MAG: hypothetical protein ABXS93_01100 [Sulfurimonas sp.]
MYYHTPNVHSYIDTVLKHRKSIIIFYILLALLAALNYQPKFLSSDELFWLKDSKELQKTQEQKFSIGNLSKLVVRIDTFNDDTLEELKQLHKQLNNLPGVEKVSSLFSNDFITTQNDQNSSNMIVVVNNEELTPFKIKKLVKELHNDYCNVVEPDFKTFYFFISTSQQIDISYLDIPGKYNYISLESEVDWFSLFIYTLVFIVIIVVIFRVLFRNYVAALAALFVIALSTILTFTAIIMLTGIYTIHITMPFITISIALVDFLYFYYRWHVSQYKTNELGALRKMLNRSMVPAMWTSILTALGLGSLVFIDSDIIKLLSLSVILSSIVGYLLNLTLLPALLSHFQIEHTHVPYAKLGYLLASNELHYNRRFLFTFLTLTYIVLVTGVYTVYSKSHNFFQLPVQNEQIELKVPYKQIDVELINSLDDLVSDLKYNFEDEVGDVTSLATVVHNLNHANTQTKELDEEALLQALFYMDLYQLSDKYFDENALTIKINLFDIDKIVLIQWLMDYEGIELYFTDNETLLGLSKYNQTILLGASLFSALLIIGLITGWIFRSRAMVFVGFTLNAIPLLWFGVLITLFNVVLSLEMLIAMTISLGLASDAAIHFAFKYFRLRYFGHSKKHTLEKVFFYAGIPVIIGSSVLILVFASLYFSSVHSLQLIGVYSSILIFLSLMTDLFILPVLLLFVDRSKRVS